MHSHIILFLFGLVVAVSGQLLPMAAPIVAPMAHIPITRSDYMSKVNHFVPVPAPIIKGVPQPYAVPVPQPYAVPRPVPVAVPRPVPVEVPRAVPMPMVAKAAPVITESLVDVGPKLIGAKAFAPAVGVLDARMMGAWGPKMFW